MTHSIYPLNLTEAEADLAEEFRRRLRDRKPDDYVEIPEGLPHAAATAIARQEATIAEPVDLEWPVDAPQPADNVNSPAHYKTGGIECFDAMRAMLSGEEMVGYLRGNSFKYRWRFRKKGGVEDLEKAEWYERKLKEIIALLP